MINAISVDVEDYFHTECMSSVAPRDRWDSFSSRVVENTEALFDIFEEEQTRATFYFLGWVAERFPQLVRRAVDLGHEIGCHSYFHHPVFRLTRKQFYEDTLRAKTVIEDAGGVRTDSYRAPSFSIIPSSYWAFDVLAELGFTRDSSIFPVWHPLYGNPDAKRVPWQTSSGVMEYPLATWRILGRNIPAAGGAYLRILPYQLVRSGIRNMNAEGWPAVLYLHPWEIDPDQPRIAQSTTSRLRQYLGLSTMKNKLRRLLREFRCGAMSDAFPVTEPVTTAKSRAAAFSEAV